MLARDIRIKVLEEIRGPKGRKIVLPIEDCVNNWLAAHPTYFIIDMKYSRAGTENNVFDRVAVMYRNGSPGQPEEVESII